MFELMMSFYMLLVFVAIPKFLDLYYDAIWKSELEIDYTYFSEKCNAIISCSNFKDADEAAKWSDYSQDLFLKSRGYP